MIEYGINRLGPDAQIFEPVTLGFPSRDNMQKSGFLGTTIGKNSVIRSGTILYCDVITGDFFQTGHNVVIREETRIGDHVSIGTATVIDGHTTIGNDVSLQSRVYIPTNTRIGNHVFIGPNAIFTNDRYPPNRSGKLSGPQVMDGAAIGANTTILPGVCIGECALVAAGAIVTRDVPDHMMAIGTPAKIMELPKIMKSDTR
ncbi:MAG: DapH/DapD/GlmU-related protein [Methanoregula sp.]|nr:DapH/DapD/GlmU-related protein [Methanoregula sp.]